MSWLEILFNWGKGMSIESYSRLRDAIRDVYKNYCTLKFLIDGLAEIIEFEFAGPAFESLMWWFYNTAVDQGLLNKNNFSAFDKEEEIWSALKSIAIELKINIHG